MTGRKIGQHTVQMAMQAIEHFYRKYEAKFDTPTIVALAIALYEFREHGDSLELTPYENAFRRIMILRHDRSYGNNKGRVALVFGYNGFDEAKTDELNELINRFTKNELISE